MHLDNPSTVQTNVASHGPFINLDHLKTIEPDYLSSLVNNSWGILSLNGLIGMTPTIAMILGRHKGILSLNSVTLIDYGSAIYLAGHQGTLFLKGVKNLDDSVAGIFATTNETIILGLESVNDQVAHILAHSHGVIGFSAQVAERVRTLVEIN